MRAAPPLVEADTAPLTPAPREERTGDPAEDMPLPHDWKTIYLGGLFLLAMLVVARVAQDVILPIVIALVLKLLLQPLVRLLERARIPKAWGAVVAVILLLAIIAGLGAVLTSPASGMLTNLPSTIRKLQGQVSLLKGWQEKAEPFLAPLGMGGAGDPTDMIHLDAGSIAASVAGGASSFAGHLLETLLILYYMLVFGEVFMLRLVEVLPRLRDKKQAVGISTTVERDISAYLLTITIINAVVGSLNAAVMWLAGVPGAPLWGVVAFALNYVPILGPFTGVAIWAVVGLATLGAAWTSLIPAACYLGIHFAEGEVITPLLLAKRFTLNPIAVMVGLVFWYWMWGVQGAILSVPMLAVTKIMSDRIRPLKALGHLLEG